MYRKGILDDARLSHFSRSFLYFFKYILLGDKMMYNETNAFGGKRFDLHSKIGSYCITAALYTI